MAHSKLVLWLKRNYCEALIAYHFWKLKRGVSNLERLLLTLQRDISRPSVTTGMRVRIMRFLERNDYQQSSISNYTDPYYPQRSRESYSDIYKDWDDTLH